MRLFSSLVDFLRLLFVRFTCFVLGHRDYGRTFYGTWFMNHLENFRAGEKPRFCNDCGRWVSTDPDFEDRSRDQTHVQSFLREGGTLKDLEEKFSIIVRRHELHPNLVLLKYDQLNSPMHERIVQECRGIILDESDGWRVVSRPFDKFFNFDEPNAAFIDWRTASVKEKLDGSLITVYNYDGSWYVATSGGPNAAGNVYGHDMCFETLFWMGARAEGIDAIHFDDLKHMCLMFELTSKYNRVVVRHDRPSITLIGARELATGREVSIDDPMFMNFKRVQDIDFGVSPVDVSRWVGEVEKSFDETDPLELEGYVVVDAHFNRVKVKHPGYVRLHHLRGEGMSPRRALDIIRAGEIEEIVSYFPEYEPDIMSIKDRLMILQQDLERDYERIKHIENRKEFAAEALKSRMPDALFSVKSGYVRNVEDYLYKKAKAEYIFEKIGK